MVIHNIKDIDTFSSQLNEKVGKTLCKGAYQLRDKARGILASSLNSSKQSSKFNDSIIEGIQVGKLVNNSVVKVHAFGTNKTGSGSYRARFHVGGTKERYYKTKNGKEHYTGKLTPNNAIERALRECKSLIDNNFSQLLKGK